MQITRSENGSSLTLEGRLDISAAEELRQSLCDLLDGSSSAVVDLSAVEACDTAALQVLLAARRTAERDNKNLRFESLDGAVAESCGALGVNISELRFEAGANGGVGDGV